MPDWFLNMETAQIGAIWPAFVMHFAMHFCQRGCTRTKAERRWASRHSIAACVRPIDQWLCSCGTWYVTVETPCASQILIDGRLAWLTGVLLPCLLSLLASRYGVNGFANSQLCWAKRNKPVHNCACGTNDKMTTATGNSSKYGRRTEEVSWGIKCTSRDLIQATTSFLVTLHARELALLKCNKLVEVGRARRLGKQRWPKLKMLLGSFGIFWASELGCVAAKIC